MHYADLGMEKILSGMESSRFGLRLVRYGMLKSIFFGRLIEKYFILSFCGCVCSSESGYIVQCAAHILSVIYQCCFRTLVVYIL